MKMRIKAIVKSVGTSEYEVPDTFNDNEVKEYIKDNASMLDWKDVEIEDIEYKVVEDYIFEEGEGLEPEDNTYSGGIYD